MCYTSITHSLPTQYIRECEEARASIHAWVTHVNPSTTLSIIHIRHALVSHCAFDTRGKHVMHVDPKKPPPPGGFPIYYVP